MAETTALVWFDQARTMLEKAASIDEVKDIRDRAEALRLYSKQQKDSGEMQQRCAEIKIRCERRMGEMLRDDPDFGRGKKSLTVNDFSIKQDQSHRFQTIAALPEADFEAQIATTKARGQELTSAAVYREAQQYTRTHQRTQRQAQTAGAPPPGFVTDLAALCAQVAAGTVPPFGCLYADPPWPYANQGTRAATATHYETVPLEALAALPVGRLAAPDSHLHLWTTSSFLPGALALLTAWGFGYTSQFVWVKPQLGLGNYWRSAHELLLLGVKGRCTALAQDLRSWQEYPRGPHSAKPAAVRELVARLSPGPYLELFGRQPVPGWTVWGNEVEER